ncbi:uncharacterized protein LOC107643134 isoform X1 [Arachis ipaensis]|uniref:uncharacterized protein LOC107643134 isoform X1 n=1 Tax=Arachis ipaensis TaxID=130454 RepID=UPI0007AF845E|nr:uncharacterized protein LOC107643134 isoform X1 [Arachis ipaensis]XP_020978855.1 uncharacterized protein LOC107643134 isoform X1 [Arachis ipaensis]
MAAVTNNTLALSSTFNPKSFQNPISNKFGENNYKIWQQQALVVIRGQDLESHLSKDSIQAKFNSEVDKLAGNQSITYKQWRQEDYNTISFLLASMEQDFASKMVGIEFCHEIWAKIEDYFSQSTKHKVKQLKMQLKQIKKQGSSAATYLSKIKLLTDSLVALGSPITSEKHIKIILKGLNEDYQVLLLTVNSKPEAFSLSEVETFLLTHEDMLKNFHKPESLAAQTNLTQSQSGGRRGRGDRFNRGGRNFFGSNRPQCQVCGIISLVPLS